MANSLLGHTQILSFGAREDTSTAPITTLATFDLQDEGSKSKAHWAALLSSYLEQGWRLAFTDGTGHEGHHEAGLRSTDRRGSKDRYDGAYLGTHSTVHDAGPRGISLALENERTATLGIATDSSAALKITLSLSRGAPPRSDIEPRIKRHLSRRHTLHYDTAMAWVRGHTGIEGNRRRSPKTKHSGPFPPPTHHSHPQRATCQKVSQLEQLRALAHTWPGPETPSPRSPGHKGPQTRRKPIPHNAPAASTTQRTETT